MERAGDDEFCTKLNLKDFSQCMVPSAGRSVDSPTEGRRRLIHVGAYIPHSSVCLDKTKKIPLIAEVASSSEFRRTRSHNRGPSTAIGSESPLFVPYRAVELVVM